MKLTSFTNEDFGVNTYLLEENSHAILIDPLISDELISKLLDVSIDFMILTHEHFDHIIEVNNIKQRYGIHILCGEKAKHGLSNPAINLSRYQDVIAKMVPFGKGGKTEIEEYNCYADELLEDGQLINWQGHKLYIKETPGHSKGSISILLDNQYLFSGDTIFKDYPTATRMPGGNTKAFKSITEPWLDSLPQDTMVYPGHGKAFLLKERYQK